MLCIRAEASAQGNHRQPDLAEHIKQGLRKMCMYGRNCSLKSKIDTAHTNLNTDHKIGQFAHWVLSKLGFNVFST